MRLFLGFGLVHGALRPSRVLRSCIIHIIYLISHGILFTGCMYVTIISESYPCTRYAFCYLGLYRGALFGMGVHTVRRSHRNLRVSTALLCFGIIFRS